ncbi:ABC transporter permease [Ruminiclostridium cellobioparum]|uniref:ABC transporter permease n=1 Tax=Ruminiclostridium cellobioparum TaxID=29355 RepID=UPI0028A73314|nr:ABC transporter permease [Ruminiclostridium cellobioparum]
MIIDYFKGIIKDRYILLSLINRDLQMKYRNSVLGVAWSILTPLGLVLIVGSVYSIIFGNDPRMFIPMLFAGLNPWAFLSSTADSATYAFIGAEGYIKQSTVRAQIFPLRATAVNFINLLYSILAFFTIYLFVQPDLFGPKMLMLIPGLIIIFLFAWGLANISAVITLTIRDFQPLQSLILQGLFYATPIIFPAEMLKEKGFELIYKINPFYYMLEIVRRPMLGNSLPSKDVYLISIIIAVSIYLVSVYVVMKVKKSIAFKL